MSDSSASHDKIMPAGKPSSSFITETSKSGPLGDMPISVNERSGNENTEKSVMSESFASKGSDMDTNGKSVMPQGKPSSTFINTSAVK